MPRLRARHHSARKIKICGSDGRRIWRVISMVAPVAVSPLRPTGWVYSYPQEHTVPL
jgi:hypothetical protein